MRRPFVAFVVSLFLAAGVAAETPRILPAACETSLALAAAPEHLREGADLWLFGEAGYEQVREGDNGFTCLVNRDDPRVLKPTCYDAEGSRTIVPKVLEVGRWLTAELSQEEIRARLEAGFADGTFRSPERGGVAYMLSHYNRPWDPRRQRLGWFPPHVMFYAPGVTNADIGFSGEAYMNDAVMPLVGYQGPHGFLIVRRELEARPWEHPVPECPSWVMGRHGELPPEARQFDFWLGRWDVNLRIRKDGEWPESSVRAETEVYSILDGKAVLELWDSEPIQGFSLRYFDTEQGKWMLWLNWPGKNRSGSSGLSGTFRHGRGDFFSEKPTQDGGTTISRYSFNDITPRSLRWDDAYSTDGGETWRHQWRMEFSRTARRAELPADGGDGHTYGAGQWCDLPQFRRFEALAGRHTGTLRHLDGGEWTEAPARLTGYRVLEGCVVLAILESEVDGRPYGGFHQLTWNTYASVFEETSLDSRAGSPLGVFYGDDVEGALTLTRRSAFGEEIYPVRRTWRFGDQTIQLDIEVGEEGTDGWKRVAQASFER